MMNNKIADCWWLDLENSSEGNRTTFLFAGVAWNWTLTHLEKDQIAILIQYVSANNSLFFHFYSLSIIGCSFTVQSRHSSPSESKFASLFITMFHQILFLAEKEKLCM